MSWAGVARATREGRAVIIKTTDYDARLEADGLETLAATGLPTPEVLEVDETRLVMTEVSGRPDPEGLGRALARTHRNTAAAFGYRIDNVVGPLAQVNTWTDSWSTFYAEHRLRPHLPYADPFHAARIRTAIDSGDLAELLDHGQPPALVHGDLWAGNIVDGCWLIDPAVSFSDRELDPAFAAVFGGVPDAMWRAYEEEWPLPAGWRRRRPALQLYHLLIHVRLFGGAYGAMLGERLDILGW